jgi:hypothetical protein
MDPNPNLKRSPNPQPYPSSPAQAADHAASHQQLFASVHMSSMHAVERLRDTLRNEHSFSFQARHPRNVVSCPCACALPFIVSGCIWDEPLGTGDASPS